MVGLVHVGAWAAAVLFGAGRLPGGLRGSAAAAARLPAHLGNPAAAWDPPVRAALPGPAAMWLCFGGELALGSAAVVGVWAGWRSLTWGSGGRGFGGGGLGGLVVGSASANATGFARVRDLRLLRVRRPQAGRVTLGRLGRSLLAAEAQASLAVVGPTGCGKTAGFAIPALLEWEGPVLAISVKADLLAATEAHRRRRGKVWVYDPTGAAVKAIAKTGAEAEPADGEGGGGVSVAVDTAADESSLPLATWSPLAGCATWSGAMRLAAWLCEAAQPRADTVTDGDYWYTQARKALAPYLYAAAIGGYALREVVAWCDTQEQRPIDDVLRGNSRIDHATDEAMSTERIKALKDRHRDQVRSDVIAAVRRVLADRTTGRVSFLNRPVTGWPPEMRSQLDERVEAELDALIRSEIETELAGVMRGSDLLAPLLAVRSLWAKDSRLRDSVFATLQNILSCYADPGVAASTDTSDIDPSAWLEGDNTIYVVATAHEQARLRPVLTVLAQTAIRAAYDTAAATPGGRLARPCLVLLDEAGNTAPLRDLPGYASTARSHGITLVTIWQDLAQVSAIYRDRAQTVLNNHRARLFGTGIADQATLEYVSRMIGDEPHQERNISADLAGSRLSISQHTTWRRAAPVEQLRRLRNDRAVLLYGSELPALVRLRPWFKERDLVIRARGREVAAGQRRRPWRRRRG